MQLTDRVFVITGGGNGIGRELILNMLSKGTRVAIADIDKVGIDETGNQQEVEQNGSPSITLTTPTAIG